MKRTIYIARCEKQHGDCFDIYPVQPTLQAATEVAVKDRSLMSDYDQKRSTHFVCGYVVEIDEGEDLTAAYNRLLVEDTLPLDPDEYTEVLL